MLSMRTLTILLPFTIALSCGGSTRVASDGGASDGSSGGSGSSGGGSGSGGGGMDSGTSSSGNSSGGGSGSSSGAGSSGCSSVSDASTIDASDWGDSPDGGSWSPVCPDTQPPTGTSCSGAAIGVSCEYGPAWWSIGCNSVLWCNAQDRAWTDSNPSAAGCLPEPGPNCTSCPVNPSGLSGACSNSGVSCYYGEGPNCTCSAVDTTWSCYPPSGCPSVRPRLGAACVTGPSGGCRYTCTEGMICSNGIWQFDTFACPGG
jgi:hypothetical protein